MSQPMHRAHGTIVAVQEDRFRLVTEAGETLLLTLARGGRTSRLVRWQAAGLRVNVAFSGEPNLVSGIAHSVRPDIDEWRVKIPIRLFV